MRRDNLRVMSNGINTKAFRKIVSCYQALVQEKILASYCSVAFIFFPKLHGIEESYGSITQNSYDPSYPAGKLTRKSPSQKWGFKLVEVQLLKMSRFSITLKLH